MRSSNGLMQNMSVCELKLFPCPGYLTIPPMIQLMTPIRRIPLSDFKKFLRLQELGLDAIVKNTFAMAVSRWMEKPSPRWE